jgi:hypothetical protein
VIRNFLTQVSKLSHFLILVSQLSYVTVYSELLHYMVVRSESFVENLAPPHCYLRKARIVLVHRYFKHGSHESGPILHDVGRV